jgi:LysM repeat protein
MKRFLPNYVLLIAPLLTGCIGGSGGTEYKTEVAMHRLRSDIEEIKHDIQTHQMELSVLEGKSQSNEEALLKMRKEGLNSDPGKMEKYQAHLTQIGQKILLIEKKQEELTRHLQGISLQGTEVQKALTQYKDKICEIERNLSLHNQTLSEMVKVKDHLKTLSELAITQGIVDLDGRHFQPYRVKGGDTLEKIAKEHRTSAEVLRKMNHMHNDLILAGQDLLVPKKTD